MKLTKQQLKEYHEHLDKEIKEFQLTREDVRNLNLIIYLLDDLTFMIPLWLKLDSKNSGSLKWFKEFKKRVDKIITIPTRLEKKFKKSKK